MWTFYRENTAWPYVHTIINAALYIATRNWLLSVVLMFVWEMVEYGIISQVSKTFSENPDDTILGDPIIGITIITALWLVDRATGWNIAFVVAVGPWIRFAAFVTVAVITSILATAFHESGLAILLIGALYILASVLFYAPYTGHSVQAQAWRSVVIWLYFVFIVTLLCAARNVPSGQFPYNIYMRVLFLNLVLLASALVVFVMSWRIMSTK